MNNATASPASFGLCINPEFHVNAIDAAVPGGYALDFTSAAPRRHAISIPGPEKQPMDGFSVTVWVKGAEDSCEMYDIVSNDAADGEPLWRFGVQHNGAWFWEIAHDDVRYEYLPTPQRQTIRNDQWHLLAFSYDAEGCEARLYYDGVNVATYNVEKINLVRAGGRLRVGGAPHRDFNEWELFNGMVGPTTCSAGVLGAEEIRREFESAALKSQAGELPAAVNELKVMTFNIYHGGNETGKEFGPRRVVDIIAEANADIVCLQETYGSGPKIADALGYHFYLFGSNLSIMSRYPIVAGRTAFESFRCGMATVQVSASQRINVASMWINDEPDYWEGPLFWSPERVSVQEIMDGERDRRLSESKAILADLAAETAKAEEIPVLICGDFNNGSHLDWTEATAHLHRDYVVQWPVSMFMVEAGYGDSFREVHPDPLKQPGLTWSPMKKMGIQDRIDYIYYKGSALRPVDARVIDTHPVRYPSDHAAVVVTFDLALTAAPVSMR